MSGLAGELRVRAELGRGQILGKFSRESLRTLLGACGVDRRALRIGSIEKAPTKKKIGATSKIHTKFPWRWRDSEKRSRSPAPSQPAQPARQQAIQGASAVGRAILYNTWTLHRYCPSLGRHVLHMGFLIHGCRLGKIRFSPGTPSMY